MSRYYPRCLSCWQPLADDDPSCPECCPECCPDCGATREPVTDAGYLHALEDEAKGIDPESPEYFALTREYARALNRAWLGKVTREEMEAHERRRRQPPAAHDYFRARTIARNAIAEVETALTFRRYRGTKYDDAQWPALVRKAAHAVRKVRPDLFADSEATR